MLKEAVADALLRLDPPLATRPWAGNAGRLIVPRESLLEWVRSNCKGEKPTQPSQELLSGKHGAGVKQGP